MCEWNDNVAIFTQIEQSNNDDIIIHGEYDTLKSFNDYNEFAKSFNNTTLEDLKNFLVESSFLKEQPILNRISLIVKSKKFDEQIQLWGFKERNDFLFKGFRLKKSNSESSQTFNAYIEPNEQNENDTDQALNLIGLVKQNIKVSNLDYSKLATISEPVSEKKRSFNPLTLSILNVGQANFALLASRNHTIAIDIGFPLSFEIDPLNPYEKGEISKAKCFLQNKKLYCVILTHYDYDHISGYKFWNSNQQTIWIGFNPTPLNISLGVYAQKMIAYLSKQSKFILINGNYSFKSTSGASLELFQGQPSAICTATCKVCSLNNMCGISIKISKNGFSALLPGDCMYGGWNSNLSNTNYSLLCVPHHGGVLMSCQIPKFKCNNLIFSYGSKNTYGHPDRKHISTLKKQCVPSKSYGTPFFGNHRLIFSFSTGKLYFRKTKSNIF